jgi:hypothetical protein
MSTERKLRINNHDMRRLVTDRHLFTNNNETVYAQHRGDLYVVYSYGEHFPMYAFDEVACVWLGNKDKYSRTTTTHQSLARPDTDSIRWMNTDDLRTVVAAGGYVPYCADRCTGVLAA